MREGIFEGFGTEAALAAAALALAWAANLSVAGSDALLMQAGDAVLPVAGAAGVTASLVVGGLPPRETEVFELLAKGNGTERIAEGLFIAVPTVKTHSYRLYQKLGVHSQQELIDLVEREKAQM